MTPPQRVRDSLGSCWSSGGRILDAMERGAMSIKVYCCSGGIDFFFFFSRRVNIHVLGIIQVERFLFKRRKTYHWPGTHCEDDLFSPGPAETNENILVGHVLDPRLVVILRVIPKDNAVDFVCGSAQPALLDVVENGLEFCFRTCDVGHFTDRHAERTSQDAAQVSSRMCELVCFATKLVQRNKNAQVVFAWQNFDRGASEFGRDLVEAARRQTPFGACNVKGAHRRVMRRLFGEIGDSNRLLVWG